MVDVDIPTIISRKQALALGLKRYFTGNLCSHGHLSPKYVIGNHCVQCFLIRGNDEHRKEYLLKNKENIRQRNKEYYKKNIHKFIESSTKRRSIKEKEIVIQKKKYYAKNKAAFLARVRLRQASILKRTPAWADLGKIEEIYKLRESISNKTGIVHHVDHVIPLQGKTVSGLHVEANLQIIPAKENSSKSNKFFMENI